MSLSAWLRPLSVRQYQVLKLIVDDGCTDQQIAERLGISTGTVSHHVRATFQKLGVRNRQHLTVTYWQHVNRKMPRKPPVRKEPPLPAAMEAYLTIFATTNFPHDIDADTDRRLKRALDEARATTDQKVDEERHAHRLD